MLTLTVKGARNSTLAVHHLDSYADVEELIAVYTSLGHKPESLIIDDSRSEKAA